MKEMKKDIKKVIAGKKGVINRECRIKVASAKSQQQAAGFIRGRNIKLAKLEKDYS